MKHCATFLLLAGTLSLVSCYPGQGYTPESGFAITVKADWAGGPWAPGQEYVNATGYRVVVDKVKFYASDITLYTAAGDSVVLADVRLYDLASARTETFKVPAGTYVGMRFGLGLPSSINNGDPAIYPTGHVLSPSQGMYWTWATKYRFVFFEGRYDEDAQSTAAPTQGFSMHTGMDVCFRSVEFQRPLVVDAEGSNGVELIVDLSRFFYSEEDVLDLGVENQWHGDPNSDLGTRLSDFAAGAFRLR
jgi:hypothetical protein